MLDALDSGYRKSYVSRLFNISRNTSDLWLKRREETGSFSAIRHYRRGAQGKITDLDQFRTFAREHGHLTQKGMAAQWDEAQRQAFLAQLQAYSAEQLVDVDEAGVDDTDDYAYGWCAQSERFEALKLGHRTQLISMIAAWCDRQVVAPMTFTGYAIRGWLKPGYSRVWSGN